MHDHLCEKSSLMNIRMTVHHRKIIRASVLLITLLISAASTGSAQGFARKYPGEGEFSIWCDLEARANGYTLAVNNWAYGGARFRMIDVDLAGIPVSDTTLDFNTDVDIKHGWVPDGNFLRVEMSDGDSIGFKKITPAGATLWSARFDLPDYQLKNISTITQTASGNFYVSGSVILEPLPTTMRQLFLFKLDGSGQLLWSKIWNTLSGDEYFESESYVVHPDESISLSVNRATLSGSAWVMHLDAQGNEIWHTPIGEGWSTIFGGLALNDAGQMGVPKFYGGSWAGWFMMLSPAGDTLVNQPLADYFDTTVNSINTRCIFAYPGNQGWLLSGIYSSTVQPGSRWFLLRLANDGSLKWLRRPNPFGLDLPLAGDAVMLPDGSCVLGGTVSRFDGGTTGDYLPFLMKIDSLGRIYAHSVDGRVFFDADYDCAETSGETPFPNWIAELSGQTLSSIYTVSGQDGAFFFSDVDTGYYDLKIHSPNTYWAPCDSVVSFQVPDSIDTVSTSSPVQPLADCPFMTVDLSAPFLRRCFPNTYSVHYCNNGPVTALASVQIILNPNLDSISASIPFTQAGDTLWFDLDSVGMLECGDFSFTAKVNCDSTELGETLCISAHIFPDSLCAPSSNWLGATLTGSAHCAGDSVQFTLKNIGIAPSTPGLDFIVVDDHVIMLQQPLPSIPPGAQQQIAMPANGQTWRFIAEQEPDHPGKEQVSVGVEGCNGPVQPGHLLQFPNFDGNPFTATDCQEVIGAYDPNEKNAVPRGVGPAHLITPETPLVYRIHFQNTGTDTAFTVVLRDTLSPWLDPGTIRPGASSHPYTFELTGAGMLSFTFHHIALPDSNINEAASHGFVQFSIAQRPNTPLGTILENRAGIYFDFNPVVLTNTVWHTVDTGFLQLYVSAQEPVVSGLQMRVYPNPAAETVWVALPDGQAANGLIRLFDTTGKVVLEKTVAGPVLEIRRGLLPAGVYVVEWRSEGDNIQGKVLFR